MKFIILFLGVLILSTFMVSGIKEDLFVNEAVEKINGNELYLGFISESKYNIVKLIVEEEVYYFIYDINENLVKQNKEIEKPDVVIKLNSKEFEKLVEAYENNDVKELKKMVFKALPFMVKLNVVFQCLRTDWCRAMVF